MPAPDGDQTGHVRFRKSVFGRLILQVEYESHRDEALGGPIVGWRDAEERDLYRVRHKRRTRGLDPLI